MPEVRRLTDDELLALKCQCGVALYEGIPDGGFRTVSRTSPRRICQKCSRREGEQRRRDRKPKPPRAPSEPESRMVGVTGRTCGHKWVTKTAATLDLLMTGTVKFMCPECESLRLVDINTDQDRLCVRCDKKLSRYNMGTLCFACDEIERQQWLITTRRTKQRAVAA